MTSPHQTSGDLPTLKSLLRDLSRRQQIGLTLAAAIVLAGVGWRVFLNTPGELVPLPMEERLSQGALRDLQQTFRQAGLNDFRTTEGEILVPQSRLLQYSALLPNSSTDTDSWASEWERQNNRLTPFSSSRAREATREIARARLITEMLQKLPDIQQADIVWDEDAQPGWRASPKARATVYLMPRPDRMLTLDVIRSVRLAVAGSKKNLDPTDVVVMDLARQVTYEGDLPVTVGDDLLPALRSVAELYRREIAQQISELEGADVDVRVDLPDFFAFLSEHPHEARQHLSVAAPGLLRVHIAVPERSPLQADEQTRRQLQARISRLTGIHSEQPGDDQRIMISFARPAVVPAAAPATGRSFPQWSWPKGWSLPKKWPLSRRQTTRLAALVGILLFGLVLLIIRRIRRRSARRSSSTIPAFHHVGGASSPQPRGGQLSDFDDLQLLDAATLRAVYSHATPRRWAVALRGSSIDVREHLAAALDEADAGEVRQECEQLGPVTLGDITASRQRILESARPTLIVVDEATSP